MNCAACDYPGLLADNEAVWELFGLASEVMFDSKGGVNLGNARQIADGLGLEWSGELVHKLLALVKAVKGNNGDERPGDD